MDEKVTQNTSYPFQKTLRTYEGDIADTLKSQHMSIAKIVIAEKVKKDQKFEMDAPPSPVLKNFLLFIVSVLLVGGGLYLLYAYYYLPSLHPTAPTSLSIPSIIVSDTQTEINLDTNANKTLMELLQNQRETSTIPQNSIYQYYITKKTDSIKNTITSQNFLSLLKVNAPDQFIRTLEPDFMFGIHSFNGNNAFIILKTNLYQSAFAGMLKWEDSISNDLSSILPSLIKNENSKTFATSTSQILAMRKPFIDLVIKNKDVRALTNEYERITLLYTFLDKGTILITTNEFTLKEILDRIANRSVVR
ncbi:MAG: hypothetical protein EXS50_03125 [Candidatus Taylorbacteria bacterium]|nr:hypothetical protein [Candidatus Taylorbacteria bacterium]